MNGAQDAAALLQWVGYPQSKASDDSDKNASLEEALSKCMIRRYFICIPNIHVVWSLTDAMTLGPMPTRCLGPHCSAYRVPVIIRLC